MRASSEGASLTTVVCRTRPYVNRAEEPAASASAEAGNGRSRDRRTAPSSPSRAQADGSLQFGAQRSTVTTSPRSSSPTVGESALGCCLTQVLSASTQAPKGGAG